MSPFGYNETVAAEQFPLDKDQVAALGFSWEQYPRGIYSRETLKWGSVPDSIRDLVGANIGKEIFACENCTKNYRVIPAELQFYKRMDVPLPRLCPDCRHNRRMIARGPNRLFPSEQCRCDYKVYQNTATHTHHPEGRCPNQFQTSYAPDRPEIVYCETCYNAEVA